jgi:hypothetical protein
MEYTPGPWDEIAQSIIGSWKIRKDVGKTYLHIGEALKKNDALLMAAAPEMYEALRWLLHLCSGISKSGDECHVTQEEWNEAWDSAIKAIEKAESSKEEGN